MFNWIPWTLPVAIAFIGIALMVTGLTIWGHFRPPVRRKGLLGIVTDRSERVYIALIVFALLEVISFMIPGSDTLIFTISGVVLGGVILKWG